MAINMTSDTETTLGGAASGSTQPGALMRRVAGKIDLAVRSVSERLSSKERMFFYSQLSLMMETGSPMNRSLDAIRSQTENSYLQTVIGSLIKDVEAGMPLSEALGRYERDFPAIAVGMVRAGEIRGTLYEMLAQAEQLERQRREFSSNMTRALAYPGLLILFSAAVVVFMLVYIFPKFSSLFQDMWEVLPLSTKALMLFNSLITGYWHVLLGCGAAAAAGLWRVLRVKRVRLACDRLMIAVPVAGKMVVMIYTSQLLRTLGFLISGHVPLLEALAIARETIRNTLYRAFVDSLAESAREGHGISAAFSRNAFIPETVKQVIKTGEESGRLDFVMLRLARYYDEEIEKQLKLLTVVIEPLALIIMGAVVGCIVMSIVLPIFRMSRAVH